MRALKLLFPPEPTAIASPEDCARPHASVHTLTGHSGASVVLHNSGAHHFVRKTAAGLPSNARLQAQADKQHALRMLGIPLPRVLAQGFDETGRASFDMEYFPGRTVAAAIADAAPFDVAAVIKAVEHMLWLFTTCAGEAIAPKIFENKIRDVIRAAPAIADSAALHDIRNCAQLLILRNWSGIPQSPCHGDLTLENILLTAGKSVAFIDCDEIFASSYWLDFGKLFQDLDGHWCIRALYETDAPAVRRVNAIQKLEQLKLQFHALAASLDPALTARLPQLAALSLFRAIPYAKTPALISFLCKRVFHVLES